MKNKKKKTRQTTWIWRLKKCGLKALLHVSLSLLFDLTSKQTFENVGASFQKCFFFFKFKKFTVVSLISKGKLWKEKTFILQSIALKSLLTFEIVGFSHSHVTHTFLNSVCLKDYFLSVSPFFFFGVFSSCQKCCVTFAHTKKLNPNQMF